MVKPTQMIILPFLILLTTATPVQPVSTDIVPMPLHQTKQAVKVYQTPQQPGCLTVKSANEETLSFYLFDTEGNLVYESRIQQHELQTIKGLHPGTYTYHAFVADERINGGKVEIKN
jgi:hypothetical protein